MTLVNSPDPDCGKPPCPEHGWLCAFHGTELGLCPWCHSPWARILATGRHSCEAAALWSGTHRAWRVAEAARMRQKASQRPHAVDQGKFCSHLGVCATGTPDPVVHLSETPATGSDR